MPREPCTREDLLVRFLNANKIASESSNRVALNYDKGIWQTLSDRIKRHERHIPVQKEFCKVSAYMQLRIRNHLDKDKAESSSTQYTTGYSKDTAKTSTRNTSTKGKGGKGKDTKGAGKDKFAKHGKGKGKDSKGKGKQTSK